ncbi:MAG: xanthan lyase [Prevotella sp.]|nr:xanthan lyase [Prevotella sp.]MBR1880023.1 xanthan lyase [Prevotella sp.]
MYRRITLCLLFLATLSLNAQTARDEAKLVEKLNSYFAKYKPKGTRLTQAPRMVGYQLDHQKKTLVITADEFFACQEFTPEITANIYKKIKGEIPKVYRDYQLMVMTNGMTIDELIPNRLSQNADKSRLWGDIDYDGEPWVKNISSPVKVTHGLQNRHISLWASHGRFYDQARGYWRWQRPNLFSTTEDLYTQTIVVPYLIPMLEKAGAIVFTPRERDWQKQEIIVDNDGSKANYIEVTKGDKWQTSKQPGFAFHTGTYTDGENPFVAGSARMVKTTSSKSRYSLATYQPYFQKAGRYAVYVSYQTLENSIPDALYTVWHKGERTQFHVNQQMGGGTWVYLGTFDFDAGYSEFNRVTVSNQSSEKGIVTTDAIRFGGGMGNIERDGLTSQLPRALEGARYWSQWAGMPYTVYSSKGGTNDYADDINVRSLTTNRLGGGSCYMPTIEGLKVPIELSLAFHSDAGYAKDGEGLIGSLSICTTNHHEGKLNAGISRMASRDLADALLSNETLDLKHKYGQWNRRELFDRNYSETRLPEVPSAILEMLSHQNFPDMRYGQDPNFRFTLARSIYKTILRYVNDQHGRPFVVTPLAPDHFRVELKKGVACLSWDAVNDLQEPTAKPTGYVVYTAIGDADFDNGTYVRGKTEHEVELEPGLLYHFKVAAVNRGGESFTTEVLSACSMPNANKTVMIVNGFHRVSSPAIRNTPAEQGFDLDEDPGVTYGPTLGWSGRQINFDRKQMGVEDGGLGNSGEELTGMLIAGNDFNYVMTHAKAIASAKQYNIVSCSSEAVEMGKVNLIGYDAVDLLLGLERHDGHSLKAYKTFTTHMQDALKRYTTHGGALLVSGAYVGTDMTQDADRQFLQNVLKSTWGGRSQTKDNKVKGLGTEMTYWKALNEEHYAATSADILQPVKPAFTAMQYADGYGAAIAYRSNCRLFVMGFPFECIEGEHKQASVMRGILNYLLK